MDNPEKLATQDTQCEEKQNENNAICVGHHFTHAETVMDIDSNYCFSSHILSIVGIVVVVIVFESRLNYIQHYVIKFVSDLQQVGGFQRVSFTNKIDRRDMTEI